MRTTATAGSRRPVALALAVVAGLGVAATGCGGDDAGRTARRPAASTSSARPAPSITTGFEDDAALDGAGVAHAAIAGDAARDGKRGLEVRPDDSEAYVSWGAERFGGELPFWSFRAWVRVMAWSPDESVDLFTVRDRQVVNNFDLFVGAPWRKLQWDLFRRNSVETRTEVQLGRWYLVEAKGSFETSTYTADVRIDGVDQPSIDSPGQPPSAVKEFVLGSIGTAKTNRAQFDDVSIRVSRTPLAFLGPPLATPPATDTRAAGA